LLVARLSARAAEELAVEASKPTEVPEAVTVEVQAETSVPLLSPDELRSR